MQDAPRRAVGSSTGRDPARGGEVPFPRTPRRRGAIKKPGDRVIEVLIGFVLVLVVGVVVYPLWFVVIASFSDPAAVATGEVTLLPEGFRLDGYVQILEDGRIWRGYRNSIFYSFVGTAINMLVTLPAAFALSRREFKPRRVILFLLAFTMFFSGGLIPSYLLYRDLGMLNTVWVFLLPGAVSVFNLIVARSFFESSIPEELHDAAKIDGLSYLGFFWRVVLPLSSAIIAVLSLYYFVGHWNDYFTGLVFVRDQALLPLQNILQSILLANQSSVGSQSAGGRSMQELQEFADQIKFGVIIISTLPLLVIYPLLQRFFNQGVMIGAIKG